MGRRSVALSTLMYSCRGGGRQSLSGLGATWRLSRSGMTRSGDGSGRLSCATAGRAQQINITLTTVAVRISTVVGRMRLVSARRGESLRSESLIGERPVSFEAANELRHQRPRSDQLRPVAPHEGQQVPAGHVDPLDRGQIETERTAAQARTGGPPAIFEFAHPGPAEIALEPQPDRRGAGFHRYSEHRAPRSNRGARARRVRGAR